MSDDPKLLIQQWAGLRRRANSDEATAYRPSGWPSGMAAGLVNASALVREPLAAAILRLAPGVSPPAEHVTPLRRHLAAVVGQAAAIAALEASTLDEDMAAEALWRGAYPIARRRTQALGVAEATLAGVDPGRSPALREGLASRPRLGILLNT